MFIECIGDKNETKDMYLLATKTIIIIIISSSSSSSSSNGNRTEWSTIQGVIRRVI